MDLKKQIIDQQDYTGVMKAAGICVLIPTYNNAGTLGDIISDVSKYCSDIIVVNDGSTDATAQILQSYPGIGTIAYQPNKGKGRALRTGLAHAAARGFEYAITIDSDGQHFAKDIPVFVERIQREPGSLLIGARNMEQAGVPGKSSFGNKFSNFWFWIETGITGPDTQSGFRLYPVQKLKDMRFYTRKFEFEIEVLVVAAWSGVKIDWVPVTVYYAPKETRVSHFRPFKDFTRVGILHTIAIVIALLYIKPRNFILGIFNKKKRTEFVDKYILGIGETDRIKAFSIGFGIFMGIVPIWGFQLAVAIPLAFLLKLNKAMVVLAANISIPPMIPLILFLSYRTGSLWMDDRAVAVPFSSDISLSSLGANITQYLWGAVTLAVIAGLFAGLFTYLLIKLSKRKTGLAA